MELRFAGFMLVLLGPGLRAQDTTEWALILAQARQQTREELERLPNYACLETVSRFQKPRTSPVFRPLDTLRFEVAFIGGKELYAPEGASRFQDVDLFSWMGGGALHSGAFVSMSRSLFTGESGQTTAWGAEMLEGRRTIWYGFKIPERYHQYRLQGSRGAAYVGQEGRFWVDAESLQLLRVEEHALDIPGSVEMTGVVTTIDYATAEAGDSRALLPRRVETRITGADGVEHRNVTTFSHCREYSSFSTIRYGREFGDPGPARRN